MALDGLCLSAISRQISENYIDARVEKVSQPAKDAIVLTLRFRGGSKKLLISAGAMGARLHFTEAQIENPQTPPMFCMLMRKHLSGGRLIGVRQLGFDRVLFLDFEVLNELADKVTVTLCVEIMGHNSNIILINSDGKIIDAIKRVNAEVSSVRLCLPGVKYELPPQQDKKNLLEIDKNELKSDLLSFGDVNLSKALLSLYSGLSPLLCREIAFYASKGSDMLCSELNKDAIDRIFFFVTQISSFLKEPQPTMLCDQSRTPKEFSFMPIRQYGHNMISREFESVDELLDSFYSEKDRLERVKQKSGDLLKTVVNISDRIARKLENQRLDLKKCEDKEKLRRYGDIIYANLSFIEKGASKAVLTDFYDENTPQVEIALDPRLTAAQNAQKYYNEYRKADTAEKMLTSLIKSGEAELLYIDSVFDSLTRAASESELSAIRAELFDAKYIRKKPDKKQIKTSIPYLKYTSSDGFTILCGRNNMQNDKLTLKESAKGDIWFHTQKIPGSHTVVLTEGKAVPDSTLEEAAIIAAFNSKARSSTKVAVDYTEIKNVKKPSGAKPGMVIYETFKTAIVTPDEELIKKLVSK
ncbi:MAG: NFACT family protein [Oscillospiraceae bacterium]|nr:NFACT family protein [Oscillospiraceae bacterium]